MGFFSILMLFFLHLYYPVAYSYYYKIGSFLVPKAVPTQKSIHSVKKMRSYWGIIKQSWNQRTHEKYYFWRDASGNEIDILIEKG
jgi:hypothetical protein